jgi:hypothetical protein
VPFGGLLTMGLLGGAMGLGSEAGGLLGEITGGGSANVGPQSPTFQREQQLGDLSKEAAFDTLMPESQSLLQGAESTLAGPTNYYNQLLSGNRAEMSAAEAPEINQITGQMQQQKQNISKFTPEGGGQTSLLSQLPFQQEGQVTNLLQQARPGAAQALTGIAGLQGQLSGQTAQEALGFTGQASQANATDIDALLGKAQQAIPGQQAMGAGIYDWLNSP